MACPMDFANLKYYLWLRMISSKTYEKNTFFNLGIACLFLTSIYLFSFSLGLFQNEVKDAIYSEWILSGQIDNTKPFSFQINDLVSTVSSKECFFYKTDFNASLIIYHLKQKSRFQSIAKEMDFISNPISCFQLRLFTPNQASDFFLNSSFLS